MKKLITLFLIVAFALLFIACPKESAVRRAAKASYRLSGVTLDVVNATARAFDAGLISIETKDNIADKLKIISAGGKRFNNSLEAYYREHGENLPADKIGVLNALFSNEVVAPFLEILNALKVLSADKAQSLQAAIAALRSVILIISQGFTAAGYDLKFIGEMKRINA